MIFRNIWLGHPIDDRPHGVDLSGLATIGADVVPADKPGYYHIVLPDNWRIGHQIGNRRHFVRHRTGLIREYDWQTRNQERPFIEKVHREAGWEYHSTVRSLCPHAVELDSCGRKRRSLSYTSHFIGYDWWGHNPRKPYSPDVNPVVAGGATLPQVRLQFQESRPFLGGKMNLDPRQGVTGIWVTKQACPWVEGNVVQFWPIPGIADARRRVEDEHGYNRWMKDWFDGHYPDWRDPNAYWDDPELNALDSFAERFHRHAV